MGRASGCMRHRAELLALGERAERGPYTDAALDHLARCRRCEEDLTEIMLAGHAVRRLLAEAATVDPPVEAWERLRTRVQRPVASAWRARTSLAGVIVGAGLVAALVGPVAVLHSATDAVSEPGPPPAAHQARSEEDARAMAVFLESERVQPTPPRVAIVADASTISWSGPDGLRRAVPPVHIDLNPARAD